MSQALWRRRDGVVRAGYSAGAPAEEGVLRRARHSSKPCTSTKNDGTNNTARQVDAIMPVNTVMPIDAARAGAGAAREQRVLNWST